MLAAPARPERHQFTPKRRLTATAGLILLTTVGLLSQLAGTLWGPGSPATTPFSINQAALPLSFEPNAGQTDPAVRYTAHVPGGRLFFTPSEVVLALSGPGSEEASLVSDEQAEGDSPAEEETRDVVVRMRFVGANPQPDIESAGALPGRVNYFLGSDPSKWRTNLPTYSAIRYGDLYPGISLSYEGAGGVLKGTYMVAAGADPAVIRWSYEGASKVGLDDAGNLQIQLAGEGGEAGITLTEHAPVAWQEIGGERVPVEVRYEQSKDGAVGFALGEYDPAYTLTVDPALTYSTYLGGSGEDTAGAVTVDSEGNAYIVGSTRSPDFPPPNVLPCNSCGGRDAFVAKLNNSGSGLDFLTYLGGNKSDEGAGIALDTQDNVHLTGSTRSSDFPGANAFQGVFGRCNGSGDDAFVAKLNFEGAQLLFSSCLGGSNEDEGRSIAVDGEGSSYIAGSTISSNFPITRAFQMGCGSCGGAEDAFVAKVISTSTVITLAYASYLGGNAKDEAWGIAADDSGNAYIVGSTLSTNFTNTNAYRARCGSDLCHDEDAFVTRVTTNTVGVSLVGYSTYLGGGAEDKGFGIAVDDGGNAYVTGHTFSNDFPVSSNPYTTTRASSREDAFVSVLDTFGSGPGSLIYSTYLGGRDSDRGLGIATHDGYAYLTGVTASEDFPLANPFQSTNAGGRFDAFIAKLSITPIPSPLAFSTYLGGSDEDSGNSIALDNANNVYVAGQTASTNFPLVSQPEPLRTTYGGGRYDAFVSKIDVSAPVPGTPIPGPIATEEGDQQASDVDGAIIVWEDLSSGTGDIRGINRITNQIITVASGSEDQRNPAVSGNLLVWQQRANSADDWDIYGARILTTGVVSGPIPIYDRPGDQIRPAVSHDLVVWQSSQPTTTPQSAVRWDIVGMIVTPTFTIRQPVTLTDDPSTTNQNPALDLSVDSRGTPVSVVAWQSTALTMTLPTGTPQTTTWSIVGVSMVITELIGARTPFAVPTYCGDQIDPSVSGSRVVWQAQHGPNCGSSPLVHGRWAIFGRDLKHPELGTITVPDRGDDQTSPAISGNKVVYESRPRVSETPSSSQPASIIIAELGPNNVVTNIVELTTGLASPPAPDVSNQVIVWQQPSAGFGGSVSNVGDSDIYGNVATPPPPPPSSPSPTNIATLTATITPVGTSTATAIATHTHTATHTPTPAATLTRTATDTPIPSLTPTTTNTPTPCQCILVGHVTWQGPPAQPDARQQLPITLTLKLGAARYIYTATTDASGFFTVNVGSLVAGTYQWWVKGPKYLAETGEVVLDRIAQTNEEMGLMRAGDADNDNRVNTTDFMELRTEFGVCTSDCDADFNNDQVVNGSDLGLLRRNFQEVGPDPIRPGGR